MEVKEKVPIQRQGSFKLEELASLPQFYFPKLNHANTKLAFYWDKTGRHELYVMDLDTEKISQITDGELPKTLRAGYIWSRDDTSIIFTKDYDGDENHNLHKIDLKTQNVTQLTNTPDHQEQIVDSSPDGNWYSVTANRHGQMNLYRMRADNPDEFEQITAHENPAYGGKYSPDGKWVVYTTNGEADLKNRDVYLAKPDGSFAERIIQIKVGSVDLFADWHPSSGSIAFTTDASGTHQAAIYNLETEEITYFGDNEVEEHAGEFTDDGYLVCLSQNDGSISPVIYEVDTGKRIELDFPSGIAMGTQTIDNREIILTVNTPTSPSKLIKYDIQTKEAKTLLDTEYGNIDPTLLVEAEHFYYPSLDDTQIPGILYKPRDWSDNKLYPGIVVPHGGPTGQYFMNFSMMGQFFADLGLVALFPNVRGSTGYGVEFRDACLKGWGTLDHDDWVAGRQWLIDNAAVDPDRVIVFGGSYGGYATLSCLTQSPDLWAAGCAWIPVSHLKNMYDNSEPHFKYFLRQQMGDPMEDEELWEERSPLNYVENISSPLLLVHGVNDPRCPVEESRNVVTALKDLGRKEGKDGDFEYVEYADEGHGSYSDISGRIRTLKLVSDFINRRLPV